MINREATFRWKGYYPEDLGEHSSRKVWSSCDSCGHSRWVQYRERKKLCMSCSRIGFKHSEKDNKKNSESKIGINTWSKGKKLTEEHKAKIGRNGKENGNYNPNITDEERKQGRFYPEYKEWNQKVKERDNYMCQLCGMTFNIVSHHLESYNNNKELRTTLSNGITLCEDCHDNFHHQYGYGNNTTEQLKKFVVNE